MKTAKLHLTRPLGVFASMSKNNFLFKALSKDVQRDYNSPLYTFDLSQIFRLNLTLSNMHFSSPVYQNCSSGFIQVTNFFTDKTMESMRFCGIFPEISWISQSHKGEIQVFVRPFIFIKTSISYSIQDFTEPQNLNFGFWKVKGILVHLLVFSLPQNYLFVHHVQVEHFYVVSIQITNISESKVTIFDGPGKKSAVLNPHLNENKQIYVAKSFQLVSHILDQHVHNYSEIKFQGQLASSADIWSISNNKLLFFPGSDICKDFIMCTVKIKIESHEHSVLKLNNIHYTGMENSALCNYAGIALYDVVNNSYQHLRTICPTQKYDKSYETHIMTPLERIPILGQDPHKQIFFFLTAYSSVTYTHPHSESSLPFYSSTNSALVVFYSFPRYGTLSLNLSISGSNCTSLRVDPCPDTGSQAFVSRQNVLETSGDQEKQLIEMRDNECTVVQLFRLQDERNDCKISIAPSLTKAEGNIEVFAVGFLQGKLLSWIHHKDRNGPQT